MYFFYYILKYLSLEVQNLNITVISQFNYRLKEMLQISNAFEFLIYDHQKDFLDMNHESG